ncbi:MAG: surE [Haloplasmataceae bacterium]|jgi:5'-nucleotidase|nr:surE [Haloplasmataceae bacterium]
MNILVVNDDGYESKKIKILADSFRKYGNVYIVAPHYEQSGASSSITVHKGFNVHNHGNNSWSVEGTPSDCVKYALFGLKLDVDIVASGINNGPNIGLDTIYSGTVGACMEALIYGKIALAFSSEYNQDINITDLNHVIKFILDKKLFSNQFILNINFPKVKSSKDIIITDLGIRPIEQYYEQNDGNYFVKRNFQDFVFEEHTDLWAFENGTISITPLKLGNGDITITNNLRDKLKNC